MKKLFALLTLLLITSLISCAGNNYIKNGVTGVINVRGNEPFVYLSIGTEQGNIFEIDSPDSLQKILWELQGLKVTLSIQEMRKKLNRDVVVAISHQLNHPAKKEMEK